MSEQRHRAHSAALPGPRRLIALDALRAVAVLLVIGRHLPEGLLAGPLLWTVPMTLVQRGGWVGVDLFFVLSGFLVSGILFREHQRHGTVRVGHFLIRRGFKIYPPFYLLIALTWLKMLWSGKGVDSRGLFAEVTFLQNVLGGLWGHTWSLAVEEQFYFLLALLFVALLARARRTQPAPGPEANPFAAVPRLFVFVAVAVLALRVILGMALAFSYRAHLFPTGLRIDGLLFGVALSYAFHYHGDDFVRVCRRFRPLLLLGGIALLTPVFVYPLEETPAIYTVGLTATYLGSGMILSAMVVAERAMGPVARVLARLGAYSYSIYLWHVPVVMWALPGHDLLKTHVDLEPVWLWLAVYVGGSLVVGVLAARLIEVPVLAVRDRWFPSRSGALRPAVGA